MSKKFVFQRVMSRFFVEFFLSHSAGRFRRGTLLCCVSEIFRYRKSLWIRGGKYPDFPSKFFCLTVPKNSVGDPSVLCFRKFTVAKKFMDKRGGVGGSIKIFLRKFFV